MCAIAGVLDLPVDPQVLQSMLSTMERRGPDGNGTFSDDGCYLLHSRLAVIDPEGGAQPMSACWGGERYIIVYNGELYNTQAVRALLEQYGHVFKGHSDTEVVLHAYAQWKDGCVERFNGIFAFAVWEMDRRRLFLARDRIGVKPLFYSRAGGGLVFASEIKTMLTYPSVRPNVDVQGIGQLLLFGPGSVPGMTPFRDILELEPGHLGYYEEGRLYVRRYWKLMDREHHDSFEETAQMVRFLVEDSVKRQLISDVPIGCFLSGGLDSSIITAICAKERDGLDSFSVDYVDNERYFVAGKFQPNNDDEFIRIMVQATGGRHHWTVLDPAELLGQLEEATIARDLPGMADIDFSLLAFCKDIRKDVTVALSGECADEIFGGYPWFRDPDVRDRDGFPWAQNTAMRISMMHPQLREKLDGVSWVNDMYQKTIMEADVLPGTSPLEKRMKQMVWLNFRWFMQTLLTRKDRMSMYHGLEVRVPFCDYRIAEYLYGVPWAYKDHEGREKGLLRYAMRGSLPEEVLYRKKSPYPKTHHPIYMSLVKARLERLLEQQDAPLFQVCDRKAVQRLLTEEPAWPWYGQLMTLPQTIAYLLQIDFWMERYKISIV